jgi:hypothetical protein
MKKYYFISFFIYFIPIISYSQLCDTLILKDGTEQHGIIKEIRISEIVYKKCDFIDGPNYTVEKANIFLIKYANGNKEMFSDTKSTKNIDIKSLSGKTIAELNTKEKQLLIDESSCFEVKLKDGKIYSCKIIKIEKLKTVFKYCDSQNKFITNNIYVEHIINSEGVIIYFNK